MTSDFQFFARMCRARKNVPAKITKKKCPTISWAALELTCVLKLESHQLAPNQTRDGREKCDKMRTLTYLERLHLGTGKKSSDEVTRESGQLGARAREGAAGGAGKGELSPEPRAQRPSSRASASGRPLRRRRGVSLKATREPRPYPVGRPESPPGTVLRPRGKHLSSLGMVIAQKSPKDGRRPIIYVYKHHHPWDTEEAHSSQGVDQEEPPEPRKESRHKSGAGPKLAEGGGGREAAELPAGPQGVTGPRDV